MNSLIFMLHNMIMTNFDFTNSDNNFYKVFIQFILITFLNYFFNNFNFIYKFLIFNYIKLYNLYFNKNYVELIIESQNLVLDRCGIKLTKFYYSKSFQAITYYIKEMKPIDIYSKREPDKNERDNNPVFDIFIPDQNKPFLIDETKKLYCVMKLTEDLYETNKDKADLRKKHTIKIFSNEKNTKMYDIENFIEKCIDIYKVYNLNKTINEQYYFCYNCCDEEGSELMFSEKIFQTNRTFDTVFFEDKPKFLNNLNFFLNNESWYKKKGIPYHYGILLHGSPGCGKTSIIKALLAHTNRNALVIPLNRVKTCGELENIFFQSEIKNKNIPTNKRIYIFEDIDCLCNIVKDREHSDSSEDTFDKIDFLDNEKTKLDWELLNKLTDISLKKNNDTDDELNLSCLLNLFDGILEMPGRMIVLTTNHPDKIDKALLRPGRIDANIELKKASKDIIYEILSNFYEVDIDFLINKCNDLNYNLCEYKFTPAFIINLCQNYIYDLDLCLSILSN